MLCICIFMHLFDEQFLKPHKTLWGLSTIPDTGKLKETAKTKEKGYNNMDFLLLVGRRKENIYIYIYE